ncbi:MAG: carboxypeptidase-like regulatory domain-containing protein, partial [Ignavibacteria bacterium]|nr:carboxypeptidase-like regulatory domain-containing protein [Ignavibacteria bacterium]
MMFTITKCNKVLVSAISILMFFIGTNVYAGTTGKIAGKITDKSTGELLIGANVIIIGTSMGASSDIDGNYFIINIPPGEYEVKASMMSYSSITVQKIRVSVDQTTKLDFELNPESIQMADIIVTAEKSVVRKDLTSTEETISGENISMLPLEDVSA